MVYSMIFKLKRKAGWNPKTNTNKCTIPAALKKYPHDGTPGNCLEHVYYERNEIS